MRKQKKNNGLNNRYGLPIMLFIIIFVGIGVFGRSNKQVNINEVVQQMPSIEKKVLVLNFDPILENYGGVRLHEYFHWNDPSTLEQEYIDTVRETSHGYVNYRIVERVDVDGFPIKTGQFQFTDESFVNCRKNPSTCNNEMINYQQVILDYQVCEKLNVGEVDELWLWGGPHFGYYESVMAGTGAFWTNGPVITNTSCNRHLNIMGFNYERTNSEMIEDLGHRIEGVMRKVFDSTTPTDRSNPWTRFIAYDKVDPNRSGCGTIHYPPNGTKDYDWGNLTPVTSYCLDWEHEFPLFEGDKEIVTCANWGCTGLGYKTWWLSHLPYTPGSTDGKLNNWWRYIVDYEHAIQITNEDPNYLRMSSGLQDKYLSCTLNYSDKSIYFGISSCSTNKPYKAEIEFANIQIPVNSYISKANLSFVQEGPYNNPLKLSIQLRYGKYLTRAIPWQIDGEWQSETRGTTPDFGPLLQEIVRLKSWVKGGKISVVITYQAGSGYRSINAFEKDGPALASMLVYELSSAPSPSPSPSPSINPSPSPSSSPSPTASASPRTGPGDYNGDGCVTLKDYQLVMANWGNPYTNTDLQLIKANFGKCY